MQHSRLMVHSVCFVHRSTNPLSAERVALGFSEKPGCFPLPSAALGIVAVAVVVVSFSKLPTHFSGGVGRQVCQDKLSIDLAN